MSSPMPLPTSHHSADDGLSTPTPATTTFVNMPPAEQVDPQEDIHEIVLVGGSTRSPKVFLKEYFGKEPLRDVVLVDVNALTLGIETTGGVTTNIIPRNTVIPTRKSQM